MEPVGVGSLAGPLMAMVAVRGWAVVMVDAERLRVMEGVACSAVSATELEVLAE